MLKLYDTLTRALKPLKKNEGAKFSFYCCGPTVYGPAHVGNFRTFLVQDVLRRMLELLGYNPIHVRNITDVDDKTIRQSQLEKTSLRAFTDRWADYFHSDCEALNLLPPHHEPRPTEHIGQQIALIQRLVERGHAYVSEDGVYYRLSSFPRYGRLAQVEKRENATQAFNSAGNQNRADEYDRESVSDFVLWKFKKPEDGENAWDSPWGAGRPGWHIECSAMAMHYLGETFDLHGGGEDLCFPHHENEIAQAEAATQKPFAKHWLHSAHLMVDGAKMSKSLGNLYTLADIRKQGFDPIVLRYALLLGHYRQLLNFKLESLYAAQSALTRIGKFMHELCDRLSLAAPTTFPNSAPSQWSYLGQAWQCLLEDLNVPAALGYFFKVMGNLKIQELSLDQTQLCLQECSTILYAIGIKPLEDKQLKKFVIPEAIQSLAQKRWVAKQAKDYTSADALRTEIQSKGWNIADHKEGYDIYPAAT